MASFRRDTPQTQAPGQDHNNFESHQNTWNESFTIHHLVNISQEAQRQQNQANHLMMRNAEADFYARSHRTRNLPLLNYPTHGIPSPPDSNGNQSEPPSVSNEFARVQTRPDETSLILHYLSFTTPIENYSLWSTRIILALSALHLTSHIEHGLLYPLSESDFLIWFNKDEMVKRVIMSKLHDEALEKMILTREKARLLLSGTGKRESAFGMWTYLRYAYEQKGATG